MTDEQKTSTVEPVQVDVLIRQIDHQVESITETIIANSKSVQETVNRALG